MTDTITPAFIEMAQSGAPVVLNSIFPSNGRHRLLAGKSARLLRAGDMVALHDLQTERNVEISGVTRVSHAHTGSNDPSTTYVVTDTPGAVYAIYQIPSARLVLVHQAPTTEEGR